VQSIFLSGGEPLLRDDLEDIVVYLKSKKFLLGFALTGASCAEKNKSLIEAGVDQFEITLLGADPNIHNALSVALHHLNRACEAIRMFFNTKSTADSFCSDETNIHSVESDRLHC